MYLSENVVETTYHINIAASCLCQIHYVFEIKVCYAAVFIYNTCQDLAMILARIPWPCKIVQRLTMILARMPRLTMFSIRVLWKQIFFSTYKGYIRSYQKGLFRNWRRQEIFAKGINYSIKSSSCVLPWLSCHDLDKRSMHHDLPLS